MIDDTFLTQELTETIQNMTQSEFSALCEAYRATFRDFELSSFDDPRIIVCYVVNCKDSLGNSTIEEVLNDWENRQRNTERKIMQVIKTMHGEDMVNLFNVYVEYEQIYEMCYIDDALYEFHSFSDVFDSLADDFDYNAPYVYVYKGIHSAEQNEFSAEHPLIKPHLKEIVKCVSHSCGLSDYPELKRIVEES